MVISLKNITFSYADSLEPVFKNINLNLDSERRFALVGDNGAGKTTLLKILCGEIKTDFRSVLPFNRFPFDFPDGGKSAYEAAHVIAPQTEFWEIMREADLLGLPDETLYRPFDTLSGGEQTKFKLAVIFARGGFALLDEPTDHLDIYGRKRLAKYLSAKKGFIAVSHDKAFLNECCNAVIALEGGEASVTHGGFAVYEEERGKKARADAVKKSSLEAERKRLKKSALQSCSWADAAEREKFGGNVKAKHAAVDRGFLGAKAAKMQRRAAVAEARRDKAETEIQLLLKGFKEDDELKIHCEKFFRARLVYLSDITVQVDGKPLFRNLNLTVDEGERVAVTGANGAGKTTLLKLVTGGFQNFCGVRDVSPKLKISYVPQSFSFDGTLSDYAQMYSLDDGKYKAVLKKFGFDSKDFDRPVNLFSEGQKKKAALARSLSEKANLYVWDEPLNYLDMSARERLEKAVLSSGATLLFVEHDAAFADTVATRKILL